MADIHYYFTQNKRHRLLNEWDILTLIFLFTLFFLFAWTGKQMSTPYNVGEYLPITLEPHALPKYAIRTVSRMGFALVLSLLCTFVFGTWAAKSRRAEQIIIPAIDILQSVPVLSFLSITIIGFIKLFPGSMLGPECACIFAIFTSQAWNMILGFYQTVSSVPHDLREVADMFHLSSWQRFWHIEVPFSMSGLLWNTMMSMSASWFFVVASEAISVSNQNIRLPGIGSYIWVAIEHANLQAVFYAIAAMFIVILIYDQLIFRPLIQWSEKFQYDITSQEKSHRSWFVSILQKTQLLPLLAQFLWTFFSKVINLRLLNRKHKCNRATRSEKNPTLKRYIHFFWLFLISTIILSSLTLLSHFILTTLSLHEIGIVFLLGLATCFRVIVLLVLSSLIWIPVGVWIGRRSNLTHALQPIIQFIASFPANLFFPLVVLTIVRYDLNTEIWTTPLMILGSQWYILFNVIAGASTLPKDIYQAADNFNVTGWLWWKRLGLPGIFPYFITGAITAAGGAWNASIVAEWVSWGHTTIVATGLGAYIHKYTTIGDFPRIALGTSMMCLYVLALNRLVWRPLYQLSQKHYGLS